MHGGDGLCHTKRDGRHGRPSLPLLCSHLMVAAAKHQNDRQNDDPCTVILKQRAQAVPVHIATSVGDAAHRRSLVSYATVKNVCKRQGSPQGALYATDRRGSVAEKTAVNNSPADC